MSPGSVGRWDSLGPMGRLLLPVNLGREFDSVVALACYFDESAFGRNYVVAGYLGSVDVLDQVFTPTWNQIIAEAPHPISEFHASNCRQGTEEFSAANGWTREERLALTDRLVSAIIERSNVIGIAMAIRFPGIIQDGLPETRKMRRKLEQYGYRTCIQICLYDVLKYHHDFFKPPREYIRPIPDKKGGFHKIFIESLDSAKNLAEFDGVLKDPIPGESKEFAPIQAADLLAYETRKEIENRVKGEPVSKALERLVAGRIHFARCGVFPDLPELYRLQEAGIDPAPKSQVLFHSDVDIRSSLFWRGTK